MIRLNLTNQPGLQNIDESEQFDLEGLIPDELTESPGLDSGMRPVANQRVSPGFDDIPDMPLEPSLSDNSSGMQIDDDIFKLAEANLDLIEQAEEEETGRHSRVKSAPEPEEKPEKKHKSNPYFRYIILVGAIVVIFIILGFYKKGNLTRSKVRKAAYTATESVAGTVTRKSEDIIQSAENLKSDYTKKAEDAISHIPDATRQLTSEVSEITHQASSNLAEIQQQMTVPVTTDRPVYGQPGTRAFGKSDLPVNLIQHIQVGQEKLILAAEVLEQFPADARFQYLRVKNDKLSFILYVNNESIANQIKNYFVNHQLFQNPDVFFIERTEKMVGNPVEIMAIVRFRTVGSNDINGYKYLSDRQLSQYIWQASVKSSVQMNPLKISSSDITAVRDAEIVGIGSTGNVISMLRELAVQRHNLSISMLSIKSDANRPVRESVLDFNLNSVIYPGNM